MMIDLNLSFLGDHFLEIIDHIGIEAANIKGAKPVCRPYCATG